MSNSNKATIHFAHANGIPAGSYQQVFKQLEPDFNCIALEKFGHNPKFRISNNWQHSIDELTDYIEKNSNEAVYAIGHSFGGVVSYMAACTKPELFKGLILLDPPIISNLERHVVRVLKKTSIIDKITPAGRTQSRRRIWPLGTDIASHYQKTSLFRNFDKRCLNDYVNAVVHERNQQLELSFSPDIEANIFRNIPDNINQYFGKLQCPAVLLTGDQTDVCRPRYLRNFIKGNNIDHKIVNGGHMFPLEYPEQTAKIIKTILAQWQ